MNEVMILDAFLWELTPGFDLMDHLGPVSLNPRDPNTVHIFVPSLLEAEREQECWVSEGPWGLGRETLS